MDCKRCSEELTALLDGELNAEDSDEVQLHAASCRWCAAELKGLRELGDFLDTHRRDLEPRAGSWNLIRSRIEQPELPRFGLHGWRRSWRLASATLALATMVAFGYLQYRQTQSRDLDRYVSQYLHDREIQLQARPVSITPAAGAPAQFEDPYASNPFADVKAVLTDNPFSSEDQ